MTIQILGTGCPKCLSLERNAREAVATSGLDATIEKVSDIDAITDMGVMMTPAIAIDGVVKKTGKVLRPEEIVALINESR